MHALYTYFSFVDIPVVIISPISSHMVYPNDQILIECSVIANPLQTRVFWQKIENGAITTINTELSKYNGSTVQSPSLIIFNTQMSDAGIYRCLAENSVGTGQSQDTLVYLSKQLLT